MKRRLASACLLLAALPAGAVLARPEAARELDRTQELYDRTLLSDHDVQVARLTSGQSLKVRVGDTRLDGVVVDPGLVPDPDSDTLQYLVEVHFDRPQGGAWRADQAAEILLP